MPEALSRFTVTTFFLVIALFGCIGILMLTCMVSGRLLDTLIPSPRVQPVPNCFAGYSDSMTYADTFNLLGIPPIQFNLPSDRANTKKSAEPDFIAVGENGVCGVVVIFEGLENEFDRIHLEVYPLADRSPSPLDVDQYLEKIETNKNLCDPVSEPQQQTSNVVSGRCFLGSGENNLVSTCSANVIYRWEEIYPIYLSSTYDISTTHRLACSVFMK